MPSLPDDLRRHPVRRALHRTKDVASTHAEILKENHTPQRLAFHLEFTCFIAHSSSVSDTLNVISLANDCEKKSITRDNVTPSSKTGGFLITTFPNAISAVF